MTDIYNLQRFIKAQEIDYEIALKELKNGMKESHWIWYIFPQLDSLGESENSKYYGIKDINEAKAYLDNELLGPRLKSLCSVLMNLNNNNPFEVMGYIDAIKLKSSMTLFGAVSPKDIFDDVLYKFFKGEKDEKTIKLLNIIKKDVNYTE